MIAFPQTRFQLLHRVFDTVIQVTTNEYPCQPLFVDERFLSFGDFPERNIPLPDAATILKRMESCLGSQYFWGGNWNEGIPEMADLYPALKDEENLLCSGVDCSGLLYQATNGFTPRNTSELIDFGQPVERLDDLKPLDLMVWKGHVVIAFSPGKFIESRIDRGVVISDFEPRYEEALEKLDGKPLYFRRWYTNVNPLYLNRSRPN